MFTLRFSCKHNGTMPSLEALIGFILMNGVRIALLLRERQSAWYGQVSLKDKAFYDQEEELILRSFASLNLA